MSSSLVTETLARPPSSRTRNRSLTPACAPSSRSVSDSSCRRARTRPATRSRMGSAPPGGVDRRGGTVGVSPLVDGTLTMRNIFHQVS